MPERGGRTRDRRESASPRAVPGPAAGGTAGGIESLTGRLAPWLLGTLGLILVVVAGLSLGWRIVHDTPVMAYLGFLFQHEHRVPYRDVWDFNLPGTYAFFAMLDRLVGSSDLGYRLGDVLWLASILAFTRAWLRPLGARVAWLASLTFGVSYLAGGQVQSLQREMLLLLPLSASLAILTRAKGWPPAWRALAGGMALGLAATIKPQVLLSLPVVLWMAGAPSQEAGKRRAGRRAIAWLCGAVGALLPLAGVGFWLAARGALREFQDLALHYWPLYAEIMGLHRVLEPEERVPYLLREWSRVGGLRVWLLPAALGCVAAFHQSSLDRAGRRLVVAVGALAGAASLFPVAAGQFWPYHWLPFHYSLIALSAAGLIPAAAGAGRLRRAVPLATLALILALGVRVPHEFLRQVRGIPEPAPLNARVDQVAFHLKWRSSPGDAAQPLDWTGGALHAMWQARMPLATRFPYDFMLYHHVSNPYVRGLRRRFLEEMRRARPRFVIRVTTRKPWVEGRDTSREFPELESLLAADYVPDQWGTGYTIYRRRDRGGPIAPRPPSR